mgnify:CR=1 FL=1
MNHVKHYTDIEQVRFPDMTIQYDLRSVEFLLPALSVQPLVENAVKHGIKSLRNETHGNITIKIFEENGNVVFRISNTSAGIDKETVENANISLKSGEMPSSKNIGLKNVNKRIQLVFGDMYGCQVYADDNVFTVEMKIPKIENL